VEMRETPYIHIIDDDKQESRVLEILLGQDGFKVGASTDSEAGLETVKEKLPDLVILDIMMPKKNGLEVMDEMREDYRTRDIPILFLSAIREEETIVKALKGADDYIVKPFGSLELKERVRKILARHAIASGATPTGPGELPYERVPVQIANEVFFIPSREIHFVKASRNYSCVHTRGKTFLADTSLGELEERLSPHGHFLRVHRSYIVNLDHVHKIRKESPQKVVIVLVDEAHSEIPVGTSYYQEVRGLLDI
jgi:DNA-binding response OmpR family regulator